MKTLILILALAVPATADTLTTYADNAILSSAEHGRRSVTLNLTHAPLADVERLADTLRARGYIIDDQAAMLNPHVIKVLRLDIRKIARGK